MPTLAGLDRAWRSLPVLMTTALCQVAAVEAAQQGPASDRLPQPAGTPVVEHKWVSIGPFGTPITNGDLIAGQVNAVAVHPGDADLVYAGSAEGGVWKSTDGGGSWSPVTDGALVRDLSSGDRKGTLSIGALAVDGADPSAYAVYVGTGDPNQACCNYGPNLGVFRSIDGGATWTPLGVDLADPATAP